MIIPIHLVNILYSSLHHGLFHSNDLLSIITHPFFHSIHPPPNFLLAEEVNMLKLRILLAQTYQQISDNRVPAAKSTECNDGYMGWSTASSFSPFPELTIMYKGTALGFALAIFANYCLMTASLPSSYPNIHLYSINNQQRVTHYSFGYDYDYRRED